MKIREYFTIKNSIFLIVAILALTFLGQIKEVVLLFFASFVVACSLNPIVNKISQYINKATAAGLIVVLTTIIVALFFVPIFVLAYKEIILFIDSLPEKITTLTTFMSNTKINDIPLITLLNLEDLATNASGIAKSVLSSSLNFTMTIIEGIGIVLSVLMIVFYFLLDRDYLKNKLSEFFPTKLRDKVKNITDSVEEKVGNYIFAQGVSMGVVGLITAIGLLFLQVKYAIVLGLITAILDLIPIIGPTLALALGVFISIQNGWLCVLGTIFVYLVAQWISNQFARPLVFGKFMNLHPLTIIFAFLVAAKFLGVWGVILAPAIASVFTVLFDELYLKPLNNSKNDEIIE